MKICKVKNCNNSVHCKLVCTKHYQQILKFGRIKRTRNDPNEIIIKNQECKMYLYDKFGNYRMSTFFDLQFLDRVEKFKWCCQKGRNTYYVGTYIRKENKKNRMLFLHQLILPCEAPLVPDHIDGNGLNNKFNNLREVTNRKNCENNIRSKNKLSGVYFEKKRNNWVSKLQYKGKNIWLGYFNTQLEAYKIREKYKKENNIK